MDLLRTNSTSSTCTTTACQQLANQIKSSLAANPNDIDPCINFDQLACGGWIAKAQVPATGNSTNVFTEVFDKNLLGLKRVIEGPYPGMIWVTKSPTAEQIAADKANFDQLQQAYHSCTDEENIAQKGLNPLAEVVRTIADLYPVDQPSRNDTTAYNPAAMGQTLLFLEQLGIPTFASVYPTKLTADDGASNTTSLIFLPNLDPDIILAAPVDASHTPKPVIPGYIEAAGMLMSALHPRGLSVDAATQLMAKVSDLEVLIRTMATVAGTKTWRMDDWDRSSPPLNLSFVAKSLARQTNREIGTVTVNSEFLGSIVKALGNATGEVVQGLLIWKATKALAPFVLSRATEALNTYRREAGQWAPDTTMPRWKTCLDTLNTGPQWLQQQNALSSVLNRLYTDNFYTVEARAEIDLVVRHIKDIYVSRIGQKDWVSAADKLSIEATVKAITPYIGFQDSIADPLALRDAASKIDITASYFSNVLSQGRARVSQFWASPQNVADLAANSLLTAMTVNAVYTRINNGIFIPAGIAQPPFYAPQAPVFALYGGFGAILAHELTHSIDRVEQAWSNSTAAAFREREECIRLEYANMTILLSNGTSVPVREDRQVENIADTGGVNNAFAAWKALQVVNPDPGLPGLESFTPSQLFFVKFAQNYCEKATPESLAKEMEFDNHAPQFARIRGTVANSRDFREAFGCKVREPTCELW